MNVPVGYVCGPTVAVKGNYGREIWWFREEANDKIERGEGRAGCKNGF